MFFSIDSCCFFPPGLCSEGSIRCPEGTCLPAEEQCDGTFHCSDESDEPITCGTLDATDYHEKH